MADRTLLEPIPVSVDRSPPREPDSQVNALGRPRPAHTVSDLVLLFTLSKCILASVKNLTRVLPDAAGLKYLVVCLVG